MQKIQIDININDAIYLKDPLQTMLGKNILRNSVELIYEIGFEQLSFKKLAKRAGTTEASIYRYFENKYMLLAYLAAWYWDFMHFMVIMDIRNLVEPKVKLKKAISTMVNSTNSIMTPEYIDQTKLHMVVVENASKVYHNRKVDKLNEEGCYMNYKRIVKTFSELILEIDVKFKYPIALATNIIEQSLNNEYYIVHLPNLTDKSKTPKDPRDETIAMINYMVDKIL